MKNQPKLPRLASASATLALLLVIDPARAADGVWNGSTDNLWSTPANWNGGNIADGAGFSADFNSLDIGSDRVVSLDSDRSLTRLTFGDTDTASASGWTLDNNGSATNNLILAGTSPGITVNGLGLNKSATVSAIIEGTAGLTKDGLGTLVLSGLNTYSGGTVINDNSGTLQTNTTSTSNPGLGSGAVAIGTGSTLNIVYANLSTNATFANTFSGAGTLKISFNSSGNRTITTNNVSGITGSIQLSKVNGNTCIWQTANGTYPSALVIGSGTQLSVGTATFTKGITVSGFDPNVGPASIKYSGTLGGNITLLADATIAYQSSNTSGQVTGNISSGASSGTQRLFMYDGSDYRKGDTFSGNISDGSTGGKISVLNNHWQNDHLAILTGTNTYTGETRVQFGILRANDGVGLPANSLLTISGRSVFETSANLVRPAGSGPGQMQLIPGPNDSNSGFNAVSAPVVVCFGTLASPTPLTWGSGSFQPSNSSFVLNKTWPNLGGYTSTIGNTIDFRNPINLGGSIRSILVDYNVATLSGVLSGSGGLTKSGNGSLKLSAANTYTGNTTVSAGTLILADDAAMAFAVTDATSTSLGGTGTATLEGDFTINTSAVTLSTGTWTLVNCATLNESFTSNFTVVGFTPNVDGVTWTKIEGTKAWTFTETDGKLVLAVAGGTPFSNWADSKGLVSPDADPDDDPDKDGNNNLAEFAFNGNPLSGADNGYFRFNIEDTNSDNLKELTLTIAVRNGSGSPVFAGSPSPAAGIDGITYAIEGSLSLVFPGSVVTETTVPTGLPALPSGWEYRRFRLDASNGLPNKGFLRARVSQP